MMCHSTLESGRRRYNGDGQCGGEQRCVGVDANGHERSLLRHECLDMRGDIVDKVQTMKKGGLLKENLSLYNLIINSMHHCDIHF